MAGLSIFLLVLATGAYAMGTGQEAPLLVALVVAILFLVFAGPFMVLAWLDARAFRS